MDWTLRIADERQGEERATLELCAECRYTCIEVYAGMVDDLIEYVVRADT